VHARGSAVRHGKRHAAPFPKAQQGDADRRQNGDLVCRGAKIRGIGEAPVLRRPAAVRAIGDPVPHLHDVAAHLSSTDDYPAVQLPQKEIADRVAVRKFEPGKALQLREGPGGEIYRREGSRIIETGRRRAPS
jgi:hypothetical protein